MATKQALYESEKRLYETLGRSMYTLHRFGDHIAEREGYAKHSGLDALHFYLIAKYGWLPAQVRGLSQDDLQFLFAEEMKGWSLPEDARV